MLLTWLATARTSSDAGSTCPMLHVLNHSRCPFSYCDPCTFDTIPHLDATFSVKTLIAHLKHNVGQRCRICAWLLLGVIVSVWIHVTALRGALPHIAAYLNPIIRARHTTSFKPKRIYVLPSLVTVHAGVIVVWDLFISYSANTAITALRSCPAEKRTQPSNTRKSGDPTEVARFHKPEEDANSNLGETLEHGFK